MREKKFLCLLLHKKYKIWTFCMRIKLDSKKFYFDGDSINLMDHFLIEFLHFNLCFTKSTILYVDFENTRGITTTQPVAPIKKNLNLTRILKNFHTLGFSIWSFSSLKFRKYFSKSRKTLQKYDTNWFRVFKLTVLISKVAIFEKILN